MRLDFLAVRVLPLRLLRSRVGRAGEAMSTGSEISALPPGLSSTASVPVAEREHAGQLPRLVAVLHEHPDVLERHRRRSDGSRWWQAAAAGSGRRAAVRGGGRRCSTPAVPAPRAARAAGHPPADGRRRPGVPARPAVPAIQLSGRRGCRSMRRWDRHRWRARSGRRHGAAGVGCASPAVRRPLRLVRRRCRRRFHRRLRLPPPASAPICICCGNADRRSTKNPTARHDGNHDQRPIAPRPTRCLRPSTTVVVDARSGHGDRRRAGGGVRRRQQGVPLPGTEVASGVATAAALAR